MAGVHECGICSNAYDERDRKPRVLQCGHTYCQPCLQSVVSQGSPACPSCRRDIVSPVAELPVVFSLIPVSGSGGAASKNGAGKNVLCSSHQNEEDFWCRKCSVLMCKLCLVEDHYGHEFTVTDKIFSNKQVLKEIKCLVDANLGNTQRFLESLREIQQLQNCVDLAEKSLTTQCLFLSDCSNIFEDISSEPSLDQKRRVLNVLRHQAMLEGNWEGDLRSSLDQIYGWISRYQMTKFPEESPVQPEESPVQPEESPVQPEESPVQPEDYMPRGQTWEITTGAAAHRALRTTRETDHTTPKAIVRSTDESPILCLFELLQYLAVASRTVELQLMDSVEREWPREEEWFPLKTGGEKSTNFWHRRRLRALARAWRDFPAAAQASGARRGKVVAIVDCEQCTPDVGVLAVGKVARRGDGSWPLPLEVHLVGYYDLQRLKCCLASLYASAEPSLGECRVYVPGGGWLCGPGALFPLLAELGRKYSTQHRLYLDRSFQRDYRKDCRQWSSQHKVPYEWKDF